ncbi:MAG: hypothetical protein K2M07_04375 [Muribaculaceae bacterium]|nr:hypothetical protein [Muribaculaceae bacterium]
MNQTDKDIEQRIKVTDAVQKYNENPTPENSSKFLVELAKLGIVWSNNTEEEKEAAKANSPLTPGLENVLHFAYKVSE